MMSMELASFGLDESHAVVGADSGRRSEVQGVKHPDGVRLVGKGGYLGPAGPADLGGLARRGQAAAGLVTAEDERDDALAHVLVHARKSGWLDLQAGLLRHFPAQAVGDVLAEFQDAAGRLPETRRLPVRLLRGNLRF